MPAKLSAELVACGGLGDSDHLPVPNHVRVAMGGASCMGGVDTPSSLHVCSVGVGCQHLEVVGGITFSASPTSLNGPHSHMLVLFLSPCIDDLSCELEKLFKYILRQVELGYLHTSKTAVGPRGSSVPGHTSAFYLAVEA